MKAPICPHCGNECLPSGGTIGIKNEDSVSFFKADIGNRAGVTFLLNALRINAKPC